MMITQTNSQALYPTGFEDAIIGTVERCSMEPQILLDRDICLKILMERDGMSEEGSQEFFDTNILGAWMGEGTPCFTSLKKDL